MKKLHSYIATGLVILAGASSCKKINDLNPHDAIPLGSGFQSITDAQKWDAGTYNALRGNFDMSHNSTDIQADELSVSLSEGNANGGQYRWGAFFGADTPAGYWENWYAAIANIDAAIAGFPAIKTSNATDAASLKQAEGSRGSR